MRDGFQKNITNKYIILFIIQKNYLIIYLTIFKQLALCIWNNIYKDMTINIYKKYIMIKNFICKIMSII